MTEDDPKDVTSFTGVLDREEGFLTKDLRKKFEQILPNVKDTNVKEYVQSHLTLKEHTKNVFVFSSHQVTTFYI